MMKKATKKISTENWTSSTIKEQCIYHHRFESIRHAERIIADWIRFYNEERPHQSLGMQTPSESFKLAA